MNIDNDSQFGFGDSDGLAHFFLTHRFVHDQYQPVLQTNFGSSFSTFGIGSSAAEAAWAELMRQPKPVRQIPAPLSDWLTLHQRLHDAEYSIIGGTGNIAPDISEVDFSDPEQFYSWLYGHQQMHDYTNNALGIP